MTKFHKKVLESVNIPVERIAFRKDKWGEIATVYFGKASRSITIGDDYDKEQFESFLETVKQRSRSFITDAKKVYGDKWKQYVKHRS